MVAALDVDDHRDAELRAGLHAIDSRRRRQLVEVLSLARGKWQPAARGIEVVGIGGLGVLRVRDDRELQLQPAVLDDAYLAAHEPACVRGDRHFASRLRVGRHLQRREQSWLPFQNERHRIERVHMPLGQGILHPPQLEARGQLPLERRGYGALAGVLPVGVPAVLNLEGDGQLDRLPGHDGRAVGQQPAFGLTGCAAVTLVFCVYDALDGRTAVWQGSPYRPWTAISV